MRNEKPKRGRGCPSKFEMHERIDADPDHMADVAMRAKPPKEW